MYSFRAELMTDVTEGFLKSDGVYGKLRRITISPTRPEISFYRDPTNMPPLPDVYVQMETDMTFEEIWKIMDNLTDGHVMAESLETAENYTGVRKTQTLMIFEEGNGRFTELMLEECDGNSKSVCILRRTCKRSLLWKDEDIVSMEQLDGESPWIVDPKNSCATRFFVPELEDYIEISNPKTLNAYLEDYRKDVDFNDAVHDKDETDNKLKRKRGCSSDGDVDIIEVKVDFEVESEENQKKSKTE